MSSFAVIFDELSLERQVSLGAAFGEKSFHFWHKIPNVWLITTIESLSPEEVRELVKGVLGNDINLIVIESKPENWSAWLPIGWHDWFIKHWAGKRNN